MTLPFLEMYIRFCQKKYVPPKPPSPPPPPTPKPSRRRRRKGARKIVKKKVDTDSPSGADKMDVLASSTPSNSNEDNGVDQYISEFVEVFELSRNMETEGKKVD